MSETKPFTVKITASQPGSWYSTYIGSKMIVYEYEGYLYLLDDFNPYAIGIGRYIRKEDCEVVPTPNPGDMPSRPVEDPKAYVQESLICNNGEPINIRYPAPSKEGASQDLPEEIMRWILSCPETVHLGSAKAMYWHLQSQLSSMKAELNDEKQHSQTIVTDLEFHRKESEAYRKAWTEAAAILEGKNLEIAQLREQVAEMREALEEAHKWASGMKYPGAMPLVEKVWNKYKKEEQK